MTIDSCNQSDQDQQPSLLLPSTIKKQVTGSPLAHQNYQRDVNSKVGSGNQLHIHWAESKAERRKHLTSRK